MIYRGPLDLDRTAEGEGGVSHRRARRRTAEQTQVRWPEMLNDDAERAGSRGGHERAQLVMAKMMDALELAGEA